MADATPTIAARFSLLLDGPVARPVTENLCGYAERLEADNERLRAVLEARVAMDSGLETNIAPLPPDSWGAQWLAWARSALAGGA